ncbi:sugar-binding protein [Streptomyces sp. NBC_00893]|uniref:sugar-binding protein n=1 Tax=Streptomyces sp. NBC_00893 TaxID=2975862 RepID=UPI00224FAF3B|nr:sugar-binding protein [Streptomyces sp. NBC_00893]MCX4851574.1 hypothetical protein [Streptomyces sp. NBC_00893]
MLSAGGKHAVRVVYTNTTDGPTRLSAVKARFGKKKVTASTRGAIVRPGKSLPVDVPIPGTAKGSTDYRVRFVTSGDAVHQLAGTLSVPAADAIAEAGPLAQIDGAPPTASVGKDPGLSADVTLAWSQEALVVDVCVADDVQRQTFTGQKIWQGDSVQVALAPGFPGETVSAGAEYGAALTSSGAESVILRNMDGSPGTRTAATSTVTRDESAKKTHYRMTLPWAELTPTAADQRLLSVSVLVNDDDGGGRSFLAWGGGISNVKDSKQYKAVTLAD